MAKRAAQPKPQPEPPQPSEIMFGTEAEIALWNFSLRVLDRQRAYQTIQDQAAAMARAVDSCRYVLAVLATEFEWTFFWVKGRAVALARGVGNDPPLSDTGIFNMPSREWVEKLMIGYGDCQAAAWLREQAILEDGEGAVQRSRELVTLIATESFYGRQPNSTDDIV
jgi:hypothetical protein